MLGWLGNIARTTTTKPHRLGATAVEGSFSGASRLRPAAAGAVRAVRQRRPGDGGVSFRSGDGVTATRLSCLPATLSINLLVYLLYAAVDPKIRYR